LSTGVHRDASCDLRGAATTGGHSIGVAPYEQRILLAGERNLSEFGYGRNGGSCQASSGRWSAGGRRSRRSAPPPRAAAPPAMSAAPACGEEASRTTPRTTLKMPQATRTPTHRRGRRYSHDLTRNLIRTGCEEGTLSARCMHRDASCDLRCRPLRSPTSQCSPHTSRRSTVRPPEPEVRLARSPGSAGDDVR
jgi:hypothetical protein